MTATSAVGFIASREDVLPRAAALGRVAARESLEDGFHSNNLDYLGGKESDCV
ncbi:hypothetical protein Dsin_017803 [Dipteronia sinensis]|uniref:Uncharacterized protein n=1 Tax=Dipteronia sinensis TaxID=43782 RepID=A0AAE0E726_9ROSI|nr:hypothetical protein Dsin_017803 [Dipteronia sinensis]